MNKKPRVAYFCMEFGLHEDFRIYSGGLGILAGDILKAAHDEQLPVVGVGILWRQGYTDQHIDKNGVPYDSFYEYKYDFLEDTGVSVNVKIRGRQVKVKVWKCTAFENAPLYLLDTFLSCNSDWYITGQLYGWFDEERIAQEMVLGIGGVRALKKLGIDADIYHFNDSHPVFAGIELIRSQMDENGLDFEKALKKVKNRIVFTTHTPVKAGNEVHKYELLKYMGAYDGLTYEQMIKLGGEPFSTTAAGLRLSRKANAVSLLHGQTARKMWKNVPEGADIISITNGVHNKTWQDSSVYSAYQSKSGLWDAHMRLKKAMIQEIFSRNNVMFDENILTIGFARRAAPYKRSDLIFSDEKAIGDLLKNRKIQIVFSGKAHPNDFEGKKIISNLVKISRKYPQSVVFLENYDMKIGKMLTRGCDVWLNNPRRPMEASGTSGMKAAMNGVLNFSVLDGWWPEGCKHCVNGWQIGCAYTGKDADEKDAASLYKVLNDEIIPTYYGNRKKWVEMMNSSIEMSTWNFSAARMLQEYYSKMYSILKFDAET
jgi:starch phosphorylase